MEGKLGWLCSLHRTTLSLITIPDTAFSEENPLLCLKCQSPLAVLSSSITRAEGTGKREPRRRREDFPLFSG